jgi:hypothetical protein
MIIAVAFDGCINSHLSGWQGVDQIPDPPVPGAIEWLMANRHHFEIHIVSSRLAERDGLLAVFDWLVARGVPDEVLSCYPAVGPAGCITLNRTRPNACVTIDARGLTFDGDWLSRRWVAEALLTFEPWHKR